MADVDVADAPRELADTATAWIERKPDQ